MLSTDTEALEANTSQPPATGVDTTSQPNTPQAITILEDVKDNEPPEPEPEKKVFTMSVKLYKHEYDFVQKILQARQSTVANGKPLTRDNNHFLRQCIRFTLNHRKGMEYFIPKGIAEVAIDT